jgi:FdhD protein
MNIVPAELLELPAVPSGELMPCDNVVDGEQLPVASHSLPVIRHRVNEVVQAHDDVAEECPVALVFNGISHAVMMVTPTELEAFAVGFALSEGIVGSLHEIYDVDICWHGAGGIEVKLDIAEPAFLRLKHQRRTLTGRTGCGICGIESLNLLDLRPEPVDASSAAQVGSAALQRILAELPKHQPITQATGCAHAAAWCTNEGMILRVFEDVGRHNALDKLLGWMAKAGIDPKSGLVFLTSRASYELVRKAARLNVPVLATISAPTALAIRIAQSAGIRLLSFCREQGFVEYPAAVEAVEE